MIKVSFQLDKSDFMLYQFYLASQSKALKNARLKKRITFPILFIAFGILLSFKLPSILLTSILWSIALLWFIFYPRWDAGKYLKRFSKLVEEHYGNRFGKWVTIELKEEKIVGNDNGYEIVAKAKDIAEIVSNPQLILIKIDETKVMLIAKSKIKKATIFEEELKAFSDKWKIPFHVLPLWSW